MPTYCRVIASTPACVLVPGRESAYDNFVMTDLPLPKITVQSNAASAATCDEIVLRSSERVRLVLRAKIVHSDKEPDAGVHATLLYQRKTKDTPWEDVPTEGLSKLKAGENVAIELKAGEVLRLRTWLNDLQSLKNAFGVPSGETYFIGVKRELDWQTLEERPLLMLPNAMSSSDFTGAVAALFERSDIDAVLTTALNLPPDRLARLGGQLGASALELALEEWDALPNDAGEEQWQDLLTRHSFALQQVFHVPTLLIGQKAYVGGKDVTNAGGSVADFLLASEATGLSMIVEIKTQKTPIVDHKAPYRNRVWNASRELSGSILQVLTYRASLHEELRHIGHKSQLQGALPKCAVIIGDSSSLDDDDKKRSFELARARADVTVLTFDELRKRLESIKSALSVIPVPAQAEPSVEPP